MLRHPAFWVGAAVIAAIEFWPQISKTTRPTTIRVIKAGLAASDHIRKSVSRAREGFDDMVAEARSEAVNDHNEIQGEPSKET